MFLLKLTGGKGGRQSSCLAVPTLRGGGYLQIPRERQLLGLLSIRVRLNEGR